LTEFVAGRSKGAKCDVPAFKEVLKARHVSENVLAMLRVRPRFVDALFGKLTKEKRTAIEARATAIVAARKQGAKKPAAKEASTRNARKSVAKTNKKPAAAGPRRRNRKRSGRQRSVTPSESEEDPVSLIEDSTDEERKGEETGETDEPEEEESEEESEEGEEDEKEDSREENTERYVTFYEAYDQTAARLEGLLARIREQPQLAKNPKAAGPPGAPFPREKLTLVDMVTQALVPSTVMHDMCLKTGSGRRKRTRVPKKARVEDSAGFKLMAKLGEISEPQPELLTAAELHSGMHVLVHQGPAAPCAWGMIPHPLPPDRQPDSYTPPISTDKNGVEQFRMQRSKQCLRLFADMRKNTDLKSDRWNGGLYDQIEIPSFYVTVWSDEHEAIAPLDFE
jgi:hypothetical protein